MKKINSLFALISICFSVFSQAPTVSSFSPSNGPVGTLVTISGTNLNNPTAITIGGASAIVVSSSTGSLTGMVMTGAVTGPISVTNASGTGSSSGNYSVTNTSHPSGQQGPKLVGTGGVGFQDQGTGVAVSADGNTAIVGGSYDNNSAGAVWMYIRSGNTWIQQGPKLVGTGAVNGSAGAYQGGAVALSADGNTAIVGGSNDSSRTGAAWIFVRSNGVWTQQGPKLVGTGGVGQPIQGCTVSLSADGNTAIVGGSGDNNLMGATWVFTRSAGIWTQQGPKLVGTGQVGNYPQQGTSVSLSADGNTAMVGAWYDHWLNTGPAVGAVWVFTRSGGVWTQQGNKLIGTGASVSGADQGSAVALSADGSTAIVGGHADSNYTGAAWIYIRSGSTWSQQGTKLVGTGAVGHAWQAVSVSISADGNTAIIGGYDDDSGRGAIWVFTRTAGVWTQQGQKLIGAGATGISAQGNAVSLSADGTIAIVGGLRDSVQGNRGAAWMFSSACAPNTSDSSISICASALPYTWHGLIFTGSGTQTLQYFNSGGCDSVVNFSLNVYPQVNDTLPQTICSGDSFIFANVVYHGAGYYSHVFTSSHGCDSTVTINLTILGAIRQDTISQSICSGDSVAFGGVSYRSGGYYSHIFTGSHGCDSTVTLHLVVFPLSFDTISRSICNGDSIVFGGTGYHSTGYYSHILTGSHGCDSTVILNLTVNPIQRTNISQNICRGSVYSFGGHNLSAPGIYTDTLSSASGCDSIVSLHLAVDTVTAFFTLQPSQTPHEWYLINQCTGHALSFLWNWGDMSTSTGDTPSHVYSAASIYNVCVTVNDSAGCQAHYCDSNVYLYKDQAGMVLINVVYQINGINTVGSDDLSINYYSRAVHFSEALHAPTHLRLYDLSGRMIMAEDNFSGDEWSINYGIADGIYIIQVQNGNRSLSKKLAVRGY